MALWQPNRAWYTAVSQEISGDPESSRVMKTAAEAAAAAAAKNRLFGRLFDYSSFFQPPHAHGLADVANGEPTALKREKADDDDGDGDVHLSNSSSRKRQPHQLDLDDVLQCLDTLDTEQVSVFVPAPPPPPPPSSAWPKKAAGAAGADGSQEAGAGLQLDHLHHSRPIRNPVSNFHRTYGNNAGALAGARDSLETPEVTPSSWMSVDGTSYEVGTAAGTVGLGCHGEDVEWDEDSGLPLITLKEVRDHDMEYDGWMVVYDKVYDVTDFLAEHPGGIEVMLDYLGRDASEAFRSVGHSSDAMEILEYYLIGILPEVERLY